MTELAHSDTPAASPWVLRWLPAAAPGASLLDYACGSGRHSRLALSLGYAVLAVDRDGSSLALVERMGANIQQEDVESGRLTLRARRFDVIICTNYLFRPRLDLLTSLLAPGGRLIYETFARGNEHFGRPSNPAFLLRPGELTGLAERAGLHLLAFEDGIVTEPRSARVQRMVAARPPVSPELLRLR